jgi:hypothetical protein
MNAQQVGRAGEMFVAAEIYRRGGYAVTFDGNMPGIDIPASRTTAGSCGSPRATSPTARTPTPPGGPGSAPTSVQCQVSGYE